MFKAVCIQDRSHYADKHISVKKGKVYLVIDVRVEKEQIINVGKESLYHHSLFIKIDDEQVDETEFKRNYKKEPA